MDSPDSKDFLEELKEQAKTSVSGGEEERQTYVDPTDGTVYEWDSQKRGWFPKVLKFVFFSPGHFKIKFISRVD